MHGQVVAFSQRCTFAVRYQSTSKDPINVVGELVAAGEVLFQGHLEQTSGLNQCEL